MSSFIGNISGSKLTSLCDIPVEVNSSRCQSLQSATSNSYVAGFLLAITVLLLLSFTQKRVSKFKNCCRGLPGIVIPLDLIHTSPYRWIYAMIFASIANSVFDIVTGQSTGIFNDAIGYINSVYLKSFLSLIWNIVMVLFWSLLYYPIFACIDSPIELLGHICGFIYTLLILLIQVLQITLQYTGCASGCSFTGELIGITILLVAPQLILQFIIMLWFLGNAIYDLYRIYSSSEPFLFKILQHRHVNYHNKRVKHLFKKPSTPDVNELSSSGKCLYYLKKVAIYVYPFEWSFHFPVRFLVTIAMVTIIMYKISLFLLYYTIKISQLLQIFASLHPLIEDSELVAHTIGKSAVVIIAKALVALAFIFPICVVLGSILMFILLFSLVRSTSTQIHKMLRGDKSFIALQTPTLYEGLASSIKYPGFQVAFFIWAWFIYTAIFLALFALIIGVIVFWIITKGAYISAIISNFLIPSIWAFIVLRIQLYACRFIFTKKNEDQGRSLDNTRLYHWFSYIFLIQNAFVGIFAALMRILYSALIGLVLLTRLDRPLLMKGFESYDRAYGAYIGTIYVNHIENNSVKITFCNLLLKIRARQQWHQDNLAEDELRVFPVNSTDIEGRNYVALDHEENLAPQVRRARNRWLVAYTLLRNTQLIEYTKASILSKQRRKEVICEMSL